MLKLTKKNTTLTYFRRITSLITLTILLAPLYSSAVVSANSHAPYGWLPRSFRNACGTPGQNHTKCQAQLLTNANTAQPLTSITYSQGYAPSDLVNAYKLPALPPVGSSFSWNGKTAAVVDAYDNPNAANDLLNYRQQFNLPLCPTSNPSPTTNDLVGCLFSKVNQNGQTTSLPAGNAGWGQEIDLDIEMVAATCPSCKILLVEASSNAYTDLGIAEDRAALMGANAISNSYGGGEFSGETTSTYNSHYNHPGVAITASAGDYGYSVEYPAASQYVTAVGGTSLTKNANTTRGWSETVWRGTGSGCSSYVPSLSYQPKIGNCTHRIVSDVSAVADPYTGVAVYDSYGSSNNANWDVFGGTSVGSPIIASLYAQAGNTIKYNEYPYGHATSLFDVTSGSNGTCTGRNLFGGKISQANAPLCQAFTGYDGPTGLGTPNGLLAF